MSNLSEFDVNCDKPSFWFSLLGFFFPIVGLILYLVYENKKPKRAKSAGKGALAGFITKIVISAAAVLISMKMIFSTKDIADIADFKVPALSTIIEENGEI